LRASAMMLSHDGGGIGVVGHVVDMKERSILIWSIGKRRR
jgi:hypothetical protein